MEYVVLSTASNPLTAIVPPKGRNPAERAAERFTVAGNAIVTGGAGGLGLAASRSLLEHGVNGLAIFDLAPSFEKSSLELKNLQAEFPAVAILHEVVDVSNEKEIEDAVERTVKELGSVNTLLCFAGIGSSQATTEMTLDEWNKVQNVNSTGTLLSAKHVAKQMIHQGTGGSIVFIASIAAQMFLFPVMQSAYAVSKAAVRRLAEVLAVEWARHGIRVNSISPGFMDTVMTQGEGATRGREVWEERNPMGRMGDPSELAGPIIMLCSPAGRYITGIDILVDGGGHTM